MSIEERKNESEYLVVLGSGYSGSGAVYDYLSGVKGFRSALGGHEFRLIHEPGGLNELYNTISGGFHPNRASDAIFRLKRLAYRCSRPRTAIPRGLGYAESIADYNNKIEAYFNDVLLMSYEGLPWVSLSDKGKLQGFMIKMMRRLFARHGVKKPCGTMHVPVEENFFFDRTRLLIDELLDDSEKKSYDDYVLVNQGGSFWRPEESTFLYRKRKVVIVNRDPRDIYSELKFKGYGYPSGDVGQFCRWYDSMMNRRRASCNRKLVCEVSFEDFVCCRDYVFVNLSEFLNIPIESLKYSSYDLSKSRGNVGKYRKVLDDFEVEEIERTLRKYIWSAE